MAGVQRSIVAGLIVMSLLFVCSCSYFKSAVITDMTPGLSKSLERLECWLTFKFNKLPSGITPRDVKIRFSSIALEKDAEYDWKYIAANDVVPKGDMQRYMENTETKPDSDPPLGMPIKVNFTLNAKQQITVPGGTKIKVKAELFWGGNLVDSDERTIEHTYSRRPN